MIHRGHREPIRQQHRHSLQQPGLDRYHGAFTDEIGAGGLVARRDLELGAAELLHLEAMPIVAAVQSAKISLALDQRHIHPQTFR